ncbi:cyclic nucleotide-binding protein-like protein [Angomonas deanei]|nr:cyclic nucleotide-binding protein-like protein [Angomonas deanei]|eukprot:EPY26179.1 cyclic nucleotide-binding protein-like protein [Angomonas deanei]
MSTDNTDPWFLTGLDVSREEQESSLPIPETSKAAQPEPLKEFQLPPMTRISKKRAYYSLAAGENRRIISEAEKKSILSRLEKPADVDEGQFKDRLTHTKDRNAEGYISTVNEKALAEAAVNEEAQMAEFSAAEQRRSDILFRHRNLIQLRHMENFVHRSQAWYEIIVSHVFITALIQERKVQEAQETFALLFIPMVKRFLKLNHLRRERQELVQEKLKNGEIPFPYPQVIQSMYGTFFTGWPPLLLEQLVSNAKPMYLKKGSYLMHEGDIGRVMFMITVGEVSIILRKKGMDKRRRKENASGVFQIKAPCYVGEFALVCKEPRSASILCETDIGFWAVSPEDYEEVAKRLSPEVANKQREATDERRRQNLKRFFPLKVDFLKNFSYFEKFSEGGLTALIEKVEPLVLHDGDFLFEQGKMDSSVYFFQDGVAVLREADGEETRILPGSCVGMFECSCGVNEKKRNSIVSINYCDIWRLSREALIDIGMSEPHALLHCRAAAKSDRAKEMKKGSALVKCAKSDPYLNFSLLPSHIVKLYEQSTPTVFLNGERLILMGQPFNSLIFLISGSVDITTAVSGEQDVYRLTVDTGGGETDGKKRVAEKSFVVGAYELASSLSQYTSSVTSFGITEAFVVDKHTLDTVIPSGLKTIIHDNVAGRDIVMKANKTKNLSLLNSNQNKSFAQLYKTQRDKQKENPKKK